MSTTPHHPAMDRGSRRGSWARAFDKVRAAMKRRRSTGRDLTATTPAHIEEANEGSSHTVDTPTETAAIAASQLETSNAPAIPEGLPAATRPAEQLLVTEPGIEVDSDDDRDEPLLPMMSSRTGVSQDKARELFAKYGLQYESKGKRAIQEPPNKIRRVEKPVRLRVHWTCHECRTQYGIEKTCVECGHRRCRDCTRHPPKRVKQMSDDARAQMQNEDRTAPEPNTAPEQVETGEPSTAIDRDLEAYQQEPSAPPRDIQSEQGEASDPKDSPRTSAAAVPGELSSPPLELDDSPDDNVPTRIDAQNVATSGVALATENHPSARLSCTIPKFSNLLRTDLLDMEDFTIRAKALLLRLGDID